MNKLNNLGLCSKSRRLISGEQRVIEAIKKKKVFLCFISKDAAFNTIKRVTDKAKFYDIPVNLEFTSDELTKAIGKENRKVIGITDENFAKLLSK